MSRALLLCFIAFAACDGARDLGPKDLSTFGPNPDDHDGDGFTPAQGDCNDDDPSVGPMAIEVGGNGIDDDCDGKVDNVAGACDGSAIGKTDAPTLAAAIGLCDARFLTKVALAGPSDPRARSIVASLGDVAHLEGDAMLFVSTGLALSPTDPGYVAPQPGTVLNQNDTIVNPDQTLQAVAGCGSTQPGTVNDSTELTLSLHVPQNAFAMSFHVQFLSSEFPEYVCSAYNDELLVEMSSRVTGGAAQNISFDAMHDPLTVNNGFFTVCTNDAAKPQTQHCGQPIDGIRGTGYDTILDGRPIGGSTGWLTTTVPVTPGDDLVLRFILFDESDHIYDSAALVDAFAWSTNSVSGPVTIQ